MTRTRCVAILLLLLTASSCTLDRAPGGAGGYDVTIRRDGHGVPHIVAADYGSLGYGEGYAFAQDHACTLADQVVRARGERARFFGRGEGSAHLASDVVARAFATDEAARLALDAAPPEMRAMLPGYADGYNRYLAETPLDRIPGWCRGEPWVRPITALDLARRGRYPSTAITEIATAAPPGAEPLSSGPAGSEGDGGVTTASNAWAIGSERSASGRGMLFANPHWFWTGAGRFWEKHLTVPGDLDVYGVNSLGNPGVGIGFNRDVACSPSGTAGSTWTAAARCSGGSSSHASSRATSCAGALFAEDFDPERALDTPRGLAPARGGRERILEALGQAVRVLERAGLPLDVPLGQVQRAPRGARQVPVHGGHGFWEGVPNFVNRRPHTTTLEPQPPAGTPVTGSRMLTSEGYPITGGTSFVMVLEYTDRGPRARALLVSGQTGDPTSPRFWEQTELYAAKRWRDVRFTDEEIRADPALTVTTLRGPRSRPD